MRQSSFFIELAQNSTFEEIAHLLIHGNLPTEAELEEYKKKLKKMRSLPPQLKAILEQVPANSHPMNVMQVACAAMGTIFPEKENLNIPDTRDIIDRLVASFGSMLIYWWQYTRSVWTQLSISSPPWPTCKASVIRSVRQMPESLTQALRLR